MKCLKCHKEFKSFIIIDGVRKNLQHRKYCLECSPWGKHNRKSLHEPKQLKYQNIPGTKEYLKEKYIKNKKHLIQSSTINQKVLRLFLIEKLGNKCNKCGYNYCANALDFHHKDKDAKLFALGSKQITRKKWKDVLIELKKCILLCSNCHREHHCNWTLMQKAKEKLETKRKALENRE